jgi:hypothetical protein
VRYQTIRVNTTEKAPDHTVDDTTYQHRPKAEGIRLKVKEKEMKPFCATLELNSILPHL